MTRRYLIPRRSVLKGTGACLALPALEIMSPAISSAGEANASIPRRLGVFHKGNGIDPSGWEASGTETEFTLSRNLKPLQSCVDDVVILANVSNQAKGDHYGAMPLFMTGVQNRNPGQTFDQVIAEHIGQSTQFDSFQLSADPVDVRSTTLNSLAYDKEGRSRFVERNAQFAFDRLFRGLSNATTRQKMGSVLDAVREPTAALLKKASGRDKDVIATYLDSVREVELEIAKHNQSQNARPHLDRISDDVIRLDDFPSKMKTMSDLVALAFWTDATRVASCIMALESSRRIHDFLGLKADFHWSSHFENKKTLAEEFNTANTWYVAQFVAAIDKMQSLTEYDGSSVFDHSVLMFGSGLGHGNKHLGTNLPLILAGGKHSGLNTGRLLGYPKQPPHANTLLTLIQHFGVERETYNNSTGTLERLFVT